MTSYERNLKEHVKLSWALLEAKVKYYLYPHLENISDAEYDHKERRYVNLCKQLYKPNTVQNMVGVDVSRPSVQLAIEKVLRE